MIPGRPWPTSSSGSSAWASRRRSTSPGTYGAGTRAAVEAFQYRRGLRVDGVCGPQTWSALVEAGRTIGDRFLYRRTPMLRGDDVAELQQRLSALGFDSGRVDGIFGDLTSAALGEFQRNVGLPVDGIAGASTVAELLRFGTRHDDTELVASVRDRERLRAAPRTLAGRRVAIGEEGGLDSTVAALRRLLVNQGAVVTTHHHPDGSIQASEVNAGGAEVYIGLRLDSDRHQCTTAYYAGYRYSSPGGRRLAELLQEDWPSRSTCRTEGARGCPCPSSARPACRRSSSRSDRPACWSSRPRASSGHRGGLGRVGGQRLGLAGGPPTVDLRLRWRPTM